MTRATVAALLLMLVGACTTLAPDPGRSSGATRPAPGVESPPAPAAPAATAPAAVTPPGPDQTLLAESRAARAAGDYATAAATLERALRISPASARLWVELAELRLLEGDREQATALAQKALTLAASEPGARQRAEAVLASGAR